MAALRVGVVGCGHISQAHLKAWKQAVNCEIYGVFDVTRTLAEKRAAQFNVPHIFETLADLIAACDIVDVCTPPQTHTAIAREVITAGKHLVMEKPVVTVESDWDELLALLKTSPTKITVIHNMKVASAARQAKAWIASGAIGKVIRIQHEFLTDASKDRMLVGNTHWSHSLPGGRWFETLPHPLYLTYYLVGALDLEHVTAMHTAQALAGAPADEVMIALRGEGVLGTIHFSSNCTLNRRAIEIVGTRGRIVIDVLGDYAALSTFADSKRKRALGGTMVQETAPLLVNWLPNRVGYAVRRFQGESPHTLLIGAFARYLNGQAEEPTPLAEVDYVIRNCEAIGREIDRQVADSRIQSTDDRTQIASGR